MSKAFFIVIVLGALCGACSNSPESEASQRKNGFTPVLKTKEDSLYQEVKDGHDVAMAKINELRKYLAEVKQKKDSIHKLPASRIDERYQQALLDAEEDLNYADYSMFTWMGEFKADTLQDNKEGRIRYLEAEKVKVLKVKENVLGSVQRADSLLHKK
jgi:hypothetical protein